MDCHRFRELLPEYLAGTLAEEVFGQMVAHEADCEACQVLAAEAMPPQTGDATADETWLAATLERTIGNDCRFIENRLAEQLDGPIDGKTLRMVQQHLGDCPTCRALAAVMEDLPAYREAFPRLRPDRAFVRQILRLTLPPRANILDVLRALCRKPEALWEGAVVCALLLTPFAGEAIPHWSQMAQRTTQVVQEHWELDQFADSLKCEVAATQSQFRDFYARRSDGMRARFSSTKVRMSAAFDEIVTQASTIDSKASRRAEEILRALDREDSINQADQPTLPAGSSDEGK